MASGAIAAGVSAAVSTAATSAVGVAIGTVSVTTAALSTAASFVLSAGSAALKSEEREGGSSFKARASGITKQFTEPIANRKIVYGKRRVSGPIVFAENTGSDDKFLHLVHVFASHQCDSISEVWLNDKQLSLDNNGFDTGSFGDNVRVKKHLGSPSQSADSDLVSEASNWTDSHRLRQMCYTYTRLEWDESKFPNGIPNVSVVLKGKNTIFDPRDDTEKYTTNPALILRDYLVDSRFGLGASDAEVNDSSFESAANVCDETVTNADGNTETRYTANGIVKSNTSYRRAIERILTSMAGSLTYSSGKFHAKAGNFRSCTNELDRSNIVSDVSIQTEVPLKETFNSVRGTYVNPNASWQPVDMQPVQDSSAINEDGEVLWQDMELPFTTSSTMARRIARIELRRSRQPRTLEANFDLEALDTKPGDTVQITYPPMNWNKKDFEVTEWGLEPGAGGAENNVPITVRMKLRETASSVYTNQQEEKDETFSTVSVRDPFVVAAPTSFNAVSDPLTNQEGTKLPRFKLTWTAPDDIYVTNGGSIEVQRKRNSDTTWDTLYFVNGGTTTTFVTSDIEANVQYDFRIRSINREGVKSSFVSDTAQSSVSNTTSARQTTVSSNTTLSESDHAVWVNASSGSIDITLPNPSNVAGRKYHIKKIDTSSNRVSVLPNGSETIDDADEQIIKHHNTSILVQSDGTNWGIL